MSARVLHEHTTIDTRQSHRKRKAEGGISKDRLDDDTASAAPIRPHRTVFMRGVFDLFHAGQLQTIYECAKLGDTVIIGVTGDTDVAQGEPHPAVRMKDRVAIIAALRDVDQVIFPCPRIITEDFMNQHKIDLVVHGFANDNDAKRQEKIFDAPIRLKRFKRISLYKGLSTGTAETCNNMSALVASKSRVHSYLVRPFRKSDP
jgi:choline-phosphate cytidylyltransferase